MVAAGYRVRAADWSGDWRRRRLGAHALVLQTGYPGRPLTDPGIPTLAVEAGTGETEPRFDLQGVDDYLVAPFCSAELLYRIRVLLRALVVPRPPATCIEDLEIDADGEVTRIGGEFVPLGPRERRVLGVLARTPGQVWRAGELATAAGLTGRSDAAVHAHLRAVIRLLRSKLEPDPARPRYILLSRRNGYLLAAPKAGRPIGEATRSVEARALDATT